jgi:hypothetical protein
MAIMAGLYRYKKVGLQVVAVVFIKPSKDSVISTAGTMKQKPATISPSTLLFRDQYE